MLKTIPSGKGIPLDVLYGKDGDMGMLSTLPSADAIPIEALRHTSQDLHALTRSGFGAPDKDENALRAEAVLPCVEPESAQTPDSTSLQKIQPVTRIPRLRCKMSEIAERSNVNPKAGFILSMIDGQMTIADILDVSSCPEWETAQMLLELERSGIVDFG